jgi:hypothetical protein
MQKSEKQHEQRTELLQQIQALAQVAIFGNATESYRTCGNPGCRCHREGPKHGPHLYISFHSEKGTRNTYVPKAAQQTVRDGLEAWKQLQVRLHELAEMNKKQALESARQQDEP